MFKRFKKKEKKDILRPYGILFYGDVYTFNTIEEAQKGCDILGLDYSEILNLIH